MFISLGDTLTVQTSLVEFYVYRDGCDGARRCAAVTWTAAAHLQGPPRRASVILASQMSPGGKHKGKWGLLVVNKVDCEKLWCPSLTEKGAYKATRRE